MIRWPLLVLPVALSIFLAGTKGGAPQQAAPGRATLSMVNGAPFKSGPVSIDNAHCGWDYVLGGGAFYTATIPAPSDFPQGCTIAITNADVAACKGKSIQVAGFPDHFVLWPGQSVELTNFDSVWVKTIDPGRWRPNCRGNLLIINTDSTKGTDLRGDFAGPRHGG